MICDTSITDLETQVSRREHDDHFDYFHFIHRVPTRLSQKRWIIYRYLSFICLKIEAQMLKFLSQPEISFQPPFLVKHV